MSLVLLESPIEIEVADDQWDVKDLTSELDFCDEGDVVIFDYTPNSNSGGIIAGVLEGDWSSEVVEESPIFNVPRYGRGQFFLKKTQDSIYSFYRQRWVSTFRILGHFKQSGFVMFDRENWINYYENEASTYGWDNGSSTNHGPQIIDFSSYLPSDAENGYAVFVKTEDTGERFRNVFHPDDISTAGDSGTRFHAGARKSLTLVPLDENLNGGVEFSGEGGATSQALMLVGYLKPGVYYRWKHSERPSLKIQEGETWYPFPLGVTGLGMVRFNNTNDNITFSTRYSFADDEVREPLVGLGQTQLIRGNRETFWETSRSGFHAVYLNEEDYDSETQSIEFFAQDGFFLDAGGSGELEITSIHTNFNSGVIRSGSELNISVSGPLSETEGTVELIYESYSTQLPITGWNTGLITATVDRGELPYNDDTTVRVTSGSDVVEFTGAVLVPIEVEYYVNGDDPNTSDEYSIFFNASQPPTSDYQIIVNDVNETGVGVNDRGEVYKSLTTGDFSYRVWDSTDGTTSTEVTRTISADNLPDAPEGVVTINNVIVDGDSLTVDFSWDEAANSGEISGFQYRIEGGEPVSFGNSNSTSTVIAGLPIGSGVVEVRARNITGFSDWSDPESFEITGVEGVPSSTPTIDNLTVNQNEITVEFSYSESDYDFFEYQINNEDPIIANVNSSFEFDFTVNQNDDYSVRVRAVNDVGVGSWSLYSHFTVTEVPIIAKIDMKALNVRAGNHPPFATTVPNFRNGWRPFVSGGSKSLKWSAPEGLYDGCTLIIETDGTENFGGSPDYSKSYYMDLTDGVLEDTSTYDTRGRNHVYDDYGLIQGKSIGAYNTPVENIRGVFAIDEPADLNGKKLFTEIFFTYTQRIPNDVELPGPGNQKPFWLMLGDRGDNFSWPQPDGTQGHDLYVIGATGGGPWGSTVLNGNNGSAAPRPQGWTLGGFNTDHWYCKLNSEDPMDAPDDYYCSRTGESFGTDFRRGATSTPLDTNEERQSIYQAFAWDRVKVPGYFNSVNDRPQEVYQSGIYLCVGENAWAHVDFCDTDQEETAGKRVIAKPVSWSENKIEVKLFYGTVNPDSDEKPSLHIRTGDGRLIVLPLE